MDGKIFLLTMMLAGTSVNAMQENHSVWFADLETNSVTGEIETAQSMVQFLPRPDRPLLVYSDGREEVYRTLYRIGGQVVGGHYSFFCEGRFVTSREIDGVIE
jgi:hypothetical protein